MEDLISHEPAGYLLASFHLRDWNMSSLRYDQTLGTYSYFCKRNSIISTSCMHYCRAIKIWNTHICMCMFYLSLLCTDVKTNMYTNETLSLQIEIWKKNPEMKKPKYSIFILTWVLVPLPCIWGSLNYQLDYLNMQLNLFHICNQRHWYLEDQCTFISYICGFNLLHFSATGFCIYFLSPNKYKQYEER